MDERQQQIDQMRTSAAKLEVLVKDLTPQQLTTVYIPGEWTVAQNIHHLADAQMNLYSRFKKMVLEDYPTFMVFDQNIWAESEDSNHPDIADSLAIVRGLQNRWARLAASLSDAQWASKGLHPENGEITAAYLFEYGSKHTLLHIEQITKTLDAGKE